ncbi:MAG: hypothetical protein JWN98_2333 [Abditibacteriota bacterium]|nr:hypothetical protein [Abditibacteriota bacterium]
MATAEFPRDAIPTSDSQPGADAATRLARNLERLAARRNTQRLLQSIVRALIPGVAVAALGILAHRFYLIDGEAWMAIAVLIAALGIGYRNGMLQKRGSFAAALDADRALNLNDRLSSALAFAQPEAVQRPRSAPSKTDPLSRARAVLFPRLEWQTAHAGAATLMVPALVHEAATRSEHLDAKVLYPARFDRRAQILTGLSVLLIAFTLMPDNTYFLSREEKKLTATLKAEGLKLQAIAKEVRKKPAVQQSEDTKKLTKRLEDMGRKMQRGRMTKLGALQGLGELKKDLQKASQNDRKSDSTDLARMEEALRNNNFETPEAQQMQQELAKGEFEKAAQQLEKLAEKMEKGELSQKEREQAANDLQKAAQALRKQGGAENQAAADQLDKAAQQMRQGSPQNQQKQQDKQQGQQSQQGQGQQQSGKQQGQQQQGSQQGQQNQNGQSQQGQQQGQGNQAGADALRNMAKGMRQNGSQMGNSQSLRDMMKKIEEAENQTGSNVGEQSGLGKDGKMCSGPG